MSPAGLCAQQDTKKDMMLFRTLVLILCSAWLLSLGSEHLKHKRSQCEGQIGMNTVVTWRSQKQSQLEVRCQQDLRCVLSPGGKISSYDPG